MWVVMMDVCRILYISVNKFLSIFHIFPALHMNGYNQLNILY